MFLCLLNHFLIRLLASSGPQQPLHVASALGLVATVRLLLHKGAKFEALDKHQQTPLHYAVKLIQRTPAPRHKLATVKMLLKRGAAHTARIKSGRIPEDAIHSAQVDSQWSPRARSARPETRNRLKSHPIICRFSDAIDLDSWSSTWPC